MIVLLTAGLTLPAACGGGDDVAPFAMPAVSTKVVDEEPTITSSTAPPAETQAEVLTRGTGRPVAAGELLVAHMKAQLWSAKEEQGKTFVDTFAQNGPPLIRGVGEFVPALEKKIPGTPIGSRVLIVSTPEDGFGAQGNPTAGIAPNDSLIFVIDILDAIAPDAMATGKAVAATSLQPGLPTVGTGKDPKVTVPKGAAPKQLVTELLQAGTGPKVVAGQTVVAQYTGILWRTGEPFDSSWKPGRTAFPALLVKPSAETGGQGVIEGWVKGLSGQRVGSRVLLVIPPKLGYGEGGNEGAGIKGTDTMVFVIDIVGAYGTPSPASK
jgi:peptidylprolyl isomerase